MNIHEYQAKALLDQYHVPIPKGIAAKDEASIDSAIAELDPQGLIVVKAQIHAGGRGKSGGVALCDTIEEVANFTKKWLGKRAQAGKIEPKSLHSKI